MGLQDERNALDGGCVGAFATFDEALLHKVLRLGEQGDALARIALATGVVGDALAVRGSREKASESELADAVRAGKEKRVRDSTGAKSSPQRGDDLPVTAKLGKGHG
jgi:hypothetical protein